MVLAQTASQVVIRSPLPELAFKRYVIYDAESVSRNRSFFILFPLLPSMIARFPSIHFIDPPLL